MAQNRSIHNREHFGSSRVPSTYWLDRLVFGKLENEARQTDALFTQLRSRIQCIDSIRALTSSDREKLELAGRGDIRRLFSDLNPLRDTCLFLRHNDMRKSDREPRKYLYEARVYWAVGRLEVAVPIKAQQRTKLVELLLRDTRLPNRAGLADFHYVMLQFSSMNEEKWKAILDPQQQKRVHKLLEGLSMNATAVCIHYGIEPCDEY